VIHSPLSDPFFSTASSRTASWTWHTQAPAGSYLTCSLLDHFAHGFWSRQAYPQTPFELTPMLTPIAGATTYRVKQVHGDRVVNCGDLAPVISSELPELVNADGLWGTQPQQALWTCTADCTPVLIGDVRTGAASAVHSGWRGTSMRIVPKAIALLESQGSQRDDLRIALGPAIDGTVYQVAEEVGVEVVNSVWQDWASPERVIDHVGLANRDQPESPLYSDTEPGKIRLDVRRVIVAQLRQLGIAAEAIAVAPHCTFQEADRFFSYRRTGEKFVQWSGIVAGGRSR
jgi:hypothetical protein